MRANKRKANLSEYTDTINDILPEDWDRVSLEKIAKIQYGKAKPKSNGNINVVGSGGIYATTNISLVNFPTLVIGRKGTAGSVWLCLEKCYPSDTTFYLDWKEDIDIFFLYNYMLFNPLSGEHAKTTLPSLQKPDLEQYLIPFPPIQEQKKIAGVLSAVQEAKEKTEEVIKAAKELKKSLMKHLFTYGAVSVEEAEKVKLKKTEIGMAPEDWQEVALDDIIEKTSNKDPRKTPSLDFKYIDVSSINRENLKIEEYKIYQGKNSPSRARKIVEKDDVIFATIRPTLKRLTFIDEDFAGEICSTAFCVLRTNKEIMYPIYLFYAVQRDIFIEELGIFQSGASYPAVTDSDVKKKKIFIPSLPIQQKIAGILSSVDKKIEAEENKKKALDELFKTLLNNLMTGRIRVNNLDIEI